MKTLWWWVGFESNGAELSPNLLTSAIWWIIFWGGNSGRWYYLEKNVLNLIWAGWMWGAFMTPRWNCLAHYFIYRWGAQEEVRTGDSNVWVIQRRGNCAHRCGPEGRERVFAFSPPPPHFLIFELVSEEYAPFFLASLLLYLQTLFFPLVPIQSFLLHLHRHSISLRQTLWNPLSCHALVHSLLS